MCKSNPEAGGTPHLAGIEVQVDDHVKGVRVVIVLRHAGRARVQEALDEAPRQERLARLDYATARTETVRL